MLLMFFKNYYLFKSRAVLSQPTEKKLLILQIPGKVYLKQIKINTMIKRFFPFMVAALLLASCGRKSGKDVSKADQKAVKIEFASLVANPSEYVDKNISVEGKVVHVCMHTGKKMFIVGEDPDIRLFISAGENVPKFPTELVGSQITVEGHLEKVVTADKPGEGTMTASLEAAASNDTAKKAETTAASTPVTAEECATEAAVARQSSLADLMMIYNKHEVVK